MEQVSLVRLLLLAEESWVFATLAGLPTCAFLGTFAGGGITAGGPTGEGTGFAGVAETGPPTV